MNLLLYIGVMKKIYVSSSKGNQSNIAIVSKIIAISMDGPSNIIKSLYTVFTDFGFSWLLIKYKSYGLISKQQFTTRS